MGLFRTRQNQKRKKARRPQCMIQSVPTMIAFLYYLRYMYQLPLHNNDVGDQELAVFGRLGTRGLEDLPVTILA